MMCSHRFLSADCLDNVDSGQSIFPTCTSPSFCLRHRLVNTHVFATVGTEVPEGDFPDEHREKKKERAVTMDGVWRKTLEVAYTFTAGKACQHWCCCGMEPPCSDCVGEKA